MSQLQLFLIRNAFKLVLNWINSTKKNSVLQAGLGVVVGDDKAESIIRILSENDLVLVHEDDL